LLLVKRSSWPWGFLNDWADNRTLTSDQGKLKGTHPALESSNPIKNGPKGEGEGEGEDAANEELGKGIWRRGTWICHHCCRSTCRSGGGGGLTASPGESLLLSPGVCDGG